mmetsp:Transcript_25682/g.59201  ORF Transcript_25682/g.59201 Transcript_25682/m.59201 type:complete len:292 (+) Transcript_25682:41-916(+)|eukprot:CAMPEP_0114552606 /NCGR_PEP_ID=MMETSP0114-20121206/7212_1 /TAXON_ID=31324 /ORGANISM="Goniomonas sp, Strain m" /LENGTH=291 /DNA_ID=CAMNT_0001737489 /DNA_START=38 /DNA_END=913 /DNA_ORIENTATION=+
MPLTAYPTPLPADKKTGDVIYGAANSTPCRFVWCIVSMFDLPVDLAHIDWATDLRSPETLAENPIHSVPWLKNLDTGVCINGSESIAAYLVAKYRAQIADSFMPSDPLAAGVVSEKVAFIMSTMYRATMYQNIYPLMGLMTECQYDICKRDFTFSICEDWASKGKGMGGAEVTMADLAYYCVHMGNSWVDDDETFSHLPWRLKNVKSKYANLMKVVGRCESHPGIQAIDKIDLGPTRPNIMAMIGGGAKMFFGQAKLPKGRTFAHLAETIHPNDVIYTPAEVKATVDIPQF